MRSDRKLPGERQPLRRRHLSLVAVALVLVGTTAVFGGWHSIQSHLPNFIEYELVSKPSKLAIVIIRRESQAAFIEAFRSFGLDHRFESLIVSGPNKGQVAIQLTGNGVRVIADNPFSDAREYHIALYQEENRSIGDVEIERYWGELRSKVNSAHSIESWLDKK